MKNENCLRNLNKSGMGRKFLCIVFLVAATSLGFAQSGSVTLVPGLNTVNNGNIGQTATPDPTIAVGTVEFCQHANSSYQCWYKNGPNAGQPVTFLGSANPKMDSTIWNQNKNNGGNTPNCGTTLTPNAQILHDNVYGRWIIQKRITSSNSPFHNYMCVAIGNAEDVSQTSPAFGWFGYEFDLDTVIPENAEGNFYYPDYPQAGLWQTSTSTTAPYPPAQDQAMWITYDLQDTNANNNTAAILVCAVDLAGLRASTGNPWVNNAKTPVCVVAHGVSPYTQRDNWVPANNTDPTPPISSDGEMFTYVIEPPHDGKTYLTDPNHTQGVEQWTINWQAAPPAVSFVNSWDLPSTQAGGDQMACFNPGNYYNTVCIPQPSTASTGVYIDSVGDRMQEPFHYSANGGKGSTWTSARSIQIVPSKTTRSQTEADVRVLTWSTGGTPAITLSEDYPFTDPNDPNAYVFLPSVARDQAGNLQGVIGTSGPGASEHPGLDSIYLTPANPTVASYGYIANPGSDGDAENTGSGDYRWGDWYGSMLDPSDSCTVWVVGEYLQANRVTPNFWYTEIAQLPPLNSCGSQVVLSAGTVSFGAEEVGVTSPAQPVTLTNNQSVTLNISNIATGGDFSQTNNCGSTLNPGASCTINVTFTPSVTGPRRGTLLVYDGVSGSPQAANLTGTGAASAVLLSPASLSFSTLAVNSQSGPLNVTLTNVGAPPLTINSVTASGNYAETNTCVGTVQPNHSCNIAVTFIPVTLGSVPGVITVNDNIPTAPQLVNLSGTSVTPVSVTPATIGFGNTTVNCGAGCAPHVLTVTNNSVSTVNLTVSASGSFSAVAGGTAPCASSLVSGGKCTLNVSFNPTWDGTVKGSVVLAFGGAFNPLVVSVSGTGVGATNPPLTFSPSLLGFSNIVVGTTAAAKVVRVTNATSSAVAITSIVASGDYAVTKAGAAPCGAALAAGTTCTVGVTFSPAAAGTIFGSLTFGGSSTILSISGGAVLPVSAMPASISFGVQSVGTTSAAQIVTVTNNQNKVLAISGLLASGDYALTAAGTNPCGASVPALGQCTIGVEFSPTVTGAIGGVLTVTTNAPFSPQDVALTGTGQ